MIKVPLAIVDFIMIKEGVIDIAGHVAKYLKKLIGLLTSSSDDCIGSQSDFPNFSQVLSDNLSGTHHFKTTGNNLKLMTLPTPSFS